MGSTTLDKHKLIDLKGNANAVVACRCTLMLIMQLAATSEERHWQASVFDRNNYGYLAFRLFDYENRLIDDAIHFWPDRLSERDKIVAGSDYAYRQELVSRILKDVKGFV